MKSDFSEKSDYVKRQQVIKKYKFPFSRISRLPKRRFTSQILSFEMTRGLARDETIHLRFNGLNPF